MTETAKSKAQHLVDFASTGLKSITARFGRDLIASVFGGYGSIHANVDASQQSGIDTDYAKLTGWADTDGIAEGVVPDQANDQLTVPLDGVYDFSGHISFGGSTNTVFTFHVFTNGVDTEEGGHRKIGSSNDEGSCNLDATAVCLAGHVIEVRVKAGGPNKNITVHETSILKVKRIG